MDNRLGQLHDIHIPAPISWWPLAKGWYALGIISVLLIISILFFILQYRKKTRAKRHALHLLTLFEAQYQKNHNPVLACARISELLKRVAISHYPRKEVANLTGFVWLDFLTKTSHGLDFHKFSFELLTLPYLKEPPSTQTDLSDLFKITHSWLKKRRGLCLH